MGRQRRRLRLARGALAGMTQAHDEYLPVQPERRRPDPLVTSPLAGGGRCSEAEAAGFAALQQEARRRVVPNRKDLIQRALGYLRRRPWTLRRVESRRSGEIQPPACRVPPA